MNWARQLILRKVVFVANESTARMSTFFVNWLKPFRNHKGELVGGWAAMIILFLKPEGVRVTKMHFEIRLGGDIP